MKKWERYFFSEIFKSFFFFLLSFFILYSLVEYSIHMDDFFKNQSLSIPGVILYYVNQFLKRVDFLLPMSLLLSTIKVLTTLHARNEWTVFQVAGLSTRKLLRPFFVVAALCSCFLWINFESFLPSALHRIEKFRVLNFRGSHATRRKELIHLVPLQDHSKMIYQSYSAETHRFFDVLWIKSQDEIWRMKYLSDNPGSPTAYYVDHLVRSEAGLFEKIESFDTLLLKELTWSSRVARKALIPFDQRKISELFSLIKNRRVSSYEIPKVKTALAFKLTMPLLAPCIVMGIAPVCFVFRRARSLFLIYALGLLSLFTVYVVIGSLTILSDHALISAFTATALPFCALISFLGWRFWVKT